MSTAASGVVALPMPARAEDTCSSLAANSENGSVPRKKPVTMRCPHVRRPRGSRPRVVHSSTRRALTPAKMRRPEIWSGASEPSPIFMSRKLDPQMSARKRNLTCHGTRATFTSGTCSAGGAAAVMGWSTLCAF